MRTRRRPLDQNLHAERHLQRYHPHDDKEASSSFGAEGPQVVRSSVLKEESCSFLSREETSGAAGADIIEHSHSSETPCVSLHVYHPPLPEAWMTG
ncbi:hypothetical protein AK812_SmicGene27547 [Symbiodinium microadriaticum]|uniref:Uncharacterized protein n=1 Tax=Symbiodinium microadriaticum TaxID=2951 RepID=A0A1Q9D6U4_SYMMI|nr:hypothetical protein AK812_SmicGene27547 [Symbiodinium microadriaticum]